MPVAFIRPGTRLEVLMSAERYGATVASEPLDDPRQERIKYWARRDIASKGICWVSALLARSAAP